MAENCRELAGYLTRSGAATKARRYLRSGSTSYLTEEEAEWLVAYGVGMDVDLRSEQEARVRPDRLAEMRGVAYANVPLYLSNLHDERLMAMADPDNYLTEGYYEMLANREAVREIFARFAEAPDGRCVLFHCAAGMDRTGVASALLLGAAGVGTRDIVFDYACSFARPPEVDAVLERRSAREGTVETLCRVMRSALAAIRTAYGSVHGYLASCGIPEDGIERAAERLLR